MRMQAVLGLKCMNNVQAPDLDGLWEYEGDICLVT